MTKNNFFIFLGIIALYFCVSFYRLADVPPPWYDEIVHLNAARHFAHEGILWCDFYKYKFKEGALFNGMPVNWLLLGYYGRLFGFDFFTARLLYLSLSMIILLCVYMLSSGMFGTKTALYSTLTLAASFAFFHNSRQIIPQVPAAAFSALAILILYLSTRHNSKLLLAASGLAAGFAGLSHPLGFIATFVIAVLLIRSRTHVASCLYFLLPFILTLAPYAVYVVVNYPEYLNQTKAVVKEMYVNQSVLMNILDDLPVRYFGLPRISLILNTRTIGGKQVNSFIYEFLWQIKHIDLRIWVCETARSLVFLFPVLYLLLKKNVSRYRKEVAIIAAIYIAVTAFHPNKFGPYVYLVMPYLAICFVLFIQDMNKKGRTTVAAFMTAVFLVSNPLFIIKELSTRKIEPYKPFICKIDRYMEKGSVVAGPVYFWPGLKDDYKFISITVLAYEVEKILKTRYNAVGFRDMPSQEKEKIVKEIISRNGIEYILMTMHQWEGITEAAALTEGLTEAVRRHLFYNSIKIVDFLKSNYYEDLPEAARFEDEVYGQRMGRPGFRNVNDEYQKSLKIYKLK